MKTILFLVLLSISITSANAQIFENWTLLPSGTTQDLYSISTTDNITSWICGANGTVLRSTDFAGAGWTIAGSSLFATLPLYNICGVNNTTALVTGSDGTGAYVYKTTNIGTNWTEVFFQPGGFINAISAINSSIIMQGDPIGGRWSLWRSTDNGSTWDSSGMYLPQAGSEAGWNNSMITPFFNTIYFGTNNSRIYLSTTGGTSWTIQTTPDVNSYAIWFNDFAPIGLAGGSQLMRTTNSGNNWTTQTAPATGNISGCTGAQNAFFFTRQGPGIYSSYDNGLTWSTDTTITGASFNCMSIINTIITENPQAVLDYRVWAVGSGGRIFAKDILLNSITPISSSNPDKYSLSQNYPNPFNPTSKIKFDITKADFVSLKIYNSLGQEVSKLVNENLTPGTYEVTFDGAGLNSGIYFYTIQSGDFVETKKMMLIK
jgi:photosystem II stability/assembly factor-like uncharacterized protein